MYVVLARFTAKLGSELVVENHLRTMIPHALREPGCKEYAVNRSIDDPRVYLLYEQYDDEAAFDAHRETQAFKDIVLQEVVPLLDAREREICTLVPPADQPS